MTVSIDRIGWIQLYTQMRSPSGFLQRFFTVKPGGIYNGCKVAIDIQRYGEQVAIVVKKCTGSNLNDFDEFTTKEFEPPAYSEAISLDVCELLNRMAGVDPYSAAYMDYASDMAAKLAKGFKLIDDKITRAVELQASQILQTGMLSLTDANGDVRYDLDFKPKATHFPTVAVNWSTSATCTPLDDLESLAKVIRADGKINPNTLIMGGPALNNFLNSTQVKERADIRRIDTISIVPEGFGETGATFYGEVVVGAYRFGIWTYPETFDDPATGNPTEYVEDDKVIMLAMSGVNGSRGTRLDMTSAGIPLPFGPDPRVASLLPDRISSREAGFDVTPNIYLTPDGRQVMGDLESRPLLIPVQIDGYGCLDTEI